MKTTILMSFLALTCTTAYAQDSRKDEETLWKLEHDYWRFVEANDLAAYSTLWNKDFLGWPSVSAAPVRKDHITDWITSQTSKGLTFKTVELKPAAVQVTGTLRWCVTGSRCGGSTRKERDHRKQFVSRTHGAKPQTSGKS
jgi:hypothetical protein